MAKRTMGLTVEPVAISEREAAALLGVSLSKANELFRSGLLPSWKDGNRRLVPYRLLIEAIEKKALEEQARIRGEVA